MLVYGTALFNGDSVTQDPILGYAYVSRAAAQGLAPAKETLAQLDKLMPLEDRKKGLALAMAKAKTAPPPSSKAGEGQGQAVQAAEPGPRRSQPQPPQPGNAQGRRRPPPPTGSWRIQLGAFLQRGSAEALYRKLASKARLPGASLITWRSGTVTRLQAGPFASRAAAPGRLHRLEAGLLPGRRQIDQPRTSRAG